MEIVISDEANETRANSLVKKYKQMADMRRDYEDIDIRDCIPTLDEMVQEDLMYELLEKAANGDTEEDVLSTAYYVDDPKGTLGYNEDLNVFNYKVKSVDVKDTDIGLNKIDGDTFYVPLNAIIEPGDSSFTTKDGQSYDSFKDYCYTKGLVNENDPADKQRIQIRLIGVDCPEIPHYDIQMMKESDIVSMTLSEAKKKNSIIQKYDWDGTTAKERVDDGKKIDFYRVKNSSGGYTYHEIRMKDPGYVTDKKSGYSYNKIVVSDESQLDTLAGGYKARDNMVELLKSGNLQFMLDANGIKANKTSSQYKLYYNHWWNAADTVKDMIDQWCNYSNVTAITRLSYSPYGTDGYGRFIGAAYAPKDGVNVNIAKYNIADSETHSVANPDFSGSPELGNLGGDNAAAFELYNYEKNNQIWLDSFSEMTKQSYKERLEFHKEVTGIDFTKVRNCTMFIGDTLLLIPPENIRSLSNIDYEKVSIMRGKGSMVKNNTNRDMFLEVDLYFYNGSGINGIQKDVKLPNGDEVTYFVDGLRSLIAQFKVAPYLPIENQFVNDVLGIEAVSLVNLTMSTVEGIPRLLRATLTMRDFNYRIYMPDVPIDYSSHQVSEIAEMNPIFAKCFNWEVFRFYYQRMISYGEKLKEIESQSGYDSLEYKKEFYSKKEALQPVFFCEKDGFGGSNISFYTPDENWLKAALSIKKDKEFYGQNPVALEPTEAGVDFIKKVGDMGKKLKVNTTHATSMANKCEVFITNPIAGGVIKKKGILADGKNTEGSVVRAKNAATNKKNGYLANLIMDAVKTVESSGVLTYIDTDESYDTKNGTLTWQVKFNLPSDLSEGDIQFIRETLKDQTGQSFDDVLSANMLTIELSTNVTNAKTIDKDVKLSCPEINAMAQYNDGVDPTEDVSAVYDYLNPAAMQFLPYLEDVELQALSFSLSNNFSDITLKIMDGFAPQYMGSSDITIEASLITTSEIIVSMLNVLPAHAANLGKLYRKVLSCWPIKVRNHYLQMVGVNEVLIDLVEVQTVHGYPGTYEIRLKMTSVDRTMRQRETLKQLESDEKSSTRAAASMYSYWDLENVLSAAELYPDLDLPSIKELNKYGFQFIRYKNTKQAYPDPDFYLNYSWPYTAYIIKKNLKDVFYNSVFHDEGKDKADILDDTAYRFFDQMGMVMYQKLDPVEGLTSTKGEGDAEQNDYADLFDESMNIIDEGIVEDVKKTDKEMARELAERDCVNLADTLIYLTACDVQQGWTIKPGLVAPVVVSELNADVEKLYCSGIEQEEVEVDEMHNAYAEDVFDLRAQAIKAIDDYLSDPIDYVKYNVVSSTTVGEDGREYTASYGDVINQVVSLFSLEEKGQAILKLFNPFEDEFGTNDDTGIKDDRYESEDSDRENGQLAPSDEMDYEAPNTMEALTGFLYAAAKCISGQKIADPEKNNKTIWEPTQFALDSHGKAKPDSNGNLVPYCTIERNGKPVGNADTLEEALNLGVQWGMFQIKIYKPNELQRILKPTSRVTYLSEEEMPMYKDKNGKERWHAGFIDPYYNLAGYRSEIGKEYIKMIATNEGINTIAFIRVLLMHMRRMIIDGLLFSEIDVVAKDYDEISSTILDDHVTTTEAFVGTFKKLLEVGGDIITLPVDLINAMVGSPIKGMAELFDDLIVDNTWGYVDDAWDMTQLDSLEEVVGSEDFAGQIKELIESLPETYSRSFCARLILPTVSAMTENDKLFNEMLVKYQISELNNLTLGAIITAGKPLSKIALFCQALSSIGFLDYSKSKTDPETTSDSQKLWNYIMREAYTKLSDDPQAFTLHSYYDMLINDKRGRLIRAFPTYYVIFMDEGRRIGSWKLFDNFYNMSAISEITVSKSRKIPADTCSFVMSNMYSSYAATYDNTTRQQYVDVYGLRDVFDSIFSPKSYFIKEDSLRRRKENLETTVLQPGVRIHVRMGYGADASRLPIAFNGKIAEIDVGEVVQVIAQGDGIEMCNPLNTLGEIDAVSLEEAQGFTTLFKDLRGSMNRGGESPRNLLSKLLTAKYGGVFKTVARSVSNDRFYGDNPFGIYHFGDNRFNNIFEEGETVQNLYEVCDATLLKGSNELYSARENTMATPTINTTIQDKTFWDILHLCANSGIGYVGALRDFGMRSTVCLCKPNHYYAFGYKIIDDEDGQTEGKIVERRKPFQQFHYYDAYTDIVYNSIKASEKNMKTNATGIWESTDVVWGKSQSTVGPIYLDFNIYPEYQRSMTVDTGLVSDGAGGLELNAITHFSEKWSADANDNKVNKALAERVTTNVLRESVSNMYCGELCVLGDTSIKPHDRFYVNDLYEDMQGHMEVEGVVYSMNAATGFTTTIYPDTIVRMNEDRIESAKRLVDASFIGSMGFCITGRLMGINTFARLDTTLLRALQKGVTTLADPKSSAVAGALGKFFSSSGKLSTIKEAGLSALKSGMSITSIATTTVVAAGLYICTNNVKSWFGSFLRNIQALSVYPIFKNQRPLIAGMAGHKGSVRGYQYTKDDADDSIQGLIVNSVEWLNKGNDKFEKVFPFEFGDILMGMFTRDLKDENGNKISEYELVRDQWMKSMPIEESNDALSLDAEGRMSQEEFIQMLYGSATTELDARRQAIPALRTKWRIPSLLVSETDRLADNVYKKYHIDGVASITDLSSHEKLLSLYPIEDEPDIKQALIKGTHPVVKELQIAHSMGNAKVQMPFESGNRIIKFFAMPGEADEGYIYDMPMLQQDALLVLKLILNDQALRNKTVMFMSGARVNDKKTWKSTGYAFVLNCSDQTALKDAIENTIKITSTLDKNKTPIFEYKEDSEGYLIIVYAEVDKYTANIPNSTEDENESNDSE